MAVKRSIVYSEEMIWLHWREEDAYHAGLTPTMDTSLRAILRWRPHFSMEVARHMTPMSRKWKSLKYVPATWQRERATELPDLKFRTVVHGCGKTIVVDKEKNSGEKNHKETTNWKRTLFYVRETLENVIRHEEKQNDAIAQ